VTLGKADFLREVMANYNVSKPLMMTETALVCPVWSNCRPVGEEFYEAQADFAVQLFARAWAADLKGVVWFQMEGPGWLYSGLLYSPVQDPKPVYLAYQFMSQKLKWAAIGPRVTQFPGIDGYEFTLYNGRLWVLWSIDREEHRLTLPAEATQVLDKYGNLIPPIWGEIIVNSPIYIELTP
jgi:hypothetical protein